MGKKNKAKEEFKEFVKGVVKDALAEADRLRKEPPGDDADDADDDDDDDDDDEENGKKERGWFDRVWNGDDE